MFLLQVRCLAAASQDVVQAVWEKVVVAAEISGTNITSALVQRTLQQSNLPCHQPGSQPVHLKSASVQWFTPADLVKVVCQVFTGGQIDLDPCSDPLAQAVVQAQSFYTQACDELIRRWFGRVYVNPPFGKVGSMSVQGQFFEKAVAEYKAKHVQEVLLLLKAAVGYSWYNQALQYPHVLLTRRIAFARPTQSPTLATPHGSIVVYLGPNIERFCSIFATLGHVPGVSSWARARKDSENLFSPSPLMNS